jgi:hypothetical protein
MVVVETYFNYRTIQNNILQFTHTCALRTSNNLLGGINVILFFLISVRDLTMLSAGGMNDVLERMRPRLIGVLSYIHLERLRKKMKDLNQDNQ